MSQYANFYIRSKGGEFLPLCSYSYHSIICEIVGDDLPYESIRPITKELVSSWYCDVSDHLEQLRGTLKDISRRKELISTFNNSVDDKMMALYDEEAAQRQCESELEDYQAARNFFTFIEDMLSEAHSTKYNEDPATLLDPGYYVFAGMECGNPTDADVL